MLATTCPHCNTPFRVISDQLKLRSGLVRCGSCHEVFNALEHLSYVDQGTADDDTLTRNQDGGDYDTRFADHQTTYVSDGIDTAAEPRHDDKPLFERVNFDDVQPAAPGASPQDRRSVDTVGAWPQRDIGDTVFGSAPDRDAAARSPFRAGIDDAGSQEASGGAPAGYGRFEGPVASEGSTLAAQAATETEPATPSALDAAGTQATLQATAPTLLADEPEPDPTPRWVWIVAGIIGVALLMHALLAFRNPIAQAMPALQGSLTALCKPLGCTLAPPRMPEMITIESADLQQDARMPGRYLLQTVVRNRASVGVALPALELTMSNALGQPELRRVFQPAEYLTPALGLTDRLQPKSEVILRIPFEAQRVDAVNYGVIIFYP